MNEIYRVTDRQNVEAMPNVKTVVTFQGDFAIESMNALFANYPKEIRATGLTFEIGTPVKNDRVIWEDCSGEELYFIHGELGWVQEEGYDFSDFHDDSPEVPAVRCSVALFDGDAPTGTPIR